MESILLKRIPEDISDYILEKQLEFRLNSHGRSFNLYQTVIKIIKEYKKLEEDGESKKD